MRALREVGLTGGIGAGKSTVAAVWVEHGAWLIDADVLAREALTPGQEPYRRVVERWGSDVMQADGSIHRQALAELIFGDAAAKSAVEAWVHPWVAEQARLRAAQAPRDALVVHDVPLLVETGRYQEMDAVVVVVAPEGARLVRLLARGISREDARLRMAAQASDEERMAVADLVISNTGTVEELRVRALEVWEQLRQAPRATL